jgi:hypothetical protein
MTQTRGLDQSYTEERYFDTEKVRVIVPHQVVARPLLISDPMDFPPDPPNTPGVFIKTVWAINFQVTEDDGEGTIVHRFNPPLVLRVEIPPSEIARALAGEDLKLAFWEGSRWLPFTKEKHHFQIHSDFALALIRHWGDPPVAWGR